jgi:hypothetical protein
MSVTLTRQELYDRVYLRKQPVGDGGVDRLGPEGIKL